MEGCGNRRSRAAETLLIAALLTSATSIGWGRASSDEDRPPVPVGVLGRIDQLVLPGTPLKVKPIDDRRQPIVLRIAASFAHGTDYRYDFVFYGLEPGTYDLRDYLQREDGSSAADIPPMIVTIESTLPSGQVKPHPLDAGTLPRVGGYQTSLISCGIVWVIGLILILLVGRRRQKKAAPSGRHSMTLAERLQVTIEDAVNGKVSQSELAELERMLIGYWRRKLDLNETAAVDAITQLKDHDQAAAALPPHARRSHNPAAATALDVAEILRRDISLLRFGFGATTVNVTASIGVANFDITTQDLDTLLQRAGAALYQSKTDGRNRSTAWGSGDVSISRARRRVLKGGKLRRAAAGDQQLFAPVPGAAGQRYAALGDTQRLGQQLDQGGVGLAFFRDRRDPGLEYRPVRPVCHAVDPVGGRIRRQPDTDGDAVRDNFEGYG